MLHNYFVANLECVYYLRTGETMARWVRSWKGRRDVCGYSVRNRFLN